MIDANHLSTTAPAAPALDAHDAAAYAQLRAQAYQDAYAAARRDTLRIAIVVALATLTGAVGAVVALRLIDVITGHCLV